MVEVYDSSGKIFLEKVLATYPDLAYDVEPGQFSTEPFQTVHPRLLIASRHPKIKSPLVVELGGYLPMYWHRGYFFDFVAEDTAGDAIDFLEKFFQEDILYGVCVRDDRALGGGPIALANVSDCKKWLTSWDDTLEIRSWLGTHDRNLKL